MDEIGGLSNVKRRRERPHVDPASVGLHYGEITVPSEVLDDVLVKEGGPSRVQATARAERRLQKRAAKTGANAVIQIRTEDAAVDRVFRWAFDRRNISPFILSGTAVRILDTGQDTDSDAEVEG